MYRPEPNNMHISGFIGGISTVWQSIGAIGDFLTSKCHYVIRQKKLLE